MNDQPPPVELLDAMARTLTNEVIPATEGPAQHSARVVANLCRILARELEESAAEPERAEAVSLLDQRLRDSTEAFDEEALPLLMADVERRLAISRPEYLTRPS